MFANKLSSPYMADQYRRAHPKTKTIVKEKILAGKSLIAKKSPAKPGPQLTDVQKEAKIKEENDAKLEQEYKAQYVGL